MHEDEYPHTSELPKVAQSVGTASVTTVNVTSLRQQWEAVVTLNSDIVCITEVRLDRDQQAKMAERMDRAGYTVLWGAPPPTRVSKRNREYLAWGGVAVAVKNHWTITEISPTDDDELTKLYNEGRFVSAEVVSPGASQRLLVHTLYATADPHKVQEHQWQVDTALACVIANGWFQRCSILAGDFNRECQQAPLNDLLEDGTLCCPFDLLDCPRADGLPGERKIDHIFCSPPMTDLVISADVIQYAPFPGHTPVTCSFNVALPTVQPRLALPQPLPTQSLPDFPNTIVDDPDVCKVDSFIAECAIDDAFAEWCTQWERYLLLQCDPSTVLSSHTGRGTCENPVWKLPSAQLRPAACYDSHLHSVVTLNKRFEALAHMSETSDESTTLRSSIRRIWCDLQSTTGSFPPWPQTDMPWEEAAWFCHHYLCELQATRKKLMLQRWRESYRQKCDPFSVRAHRYVSGKCKYNPLRGIVVDGAFQVDGPSVDAALRSTWQGIHKLQGTDAASLLDTFERKYAMLVPSHEQRDWLPLQAQDFIQALKNTKTHTAAGPCGWRACELRKLPPAAWRQLAEIFSLAEIRGQLPRLCQTLWQAAVPKIAGVPCDASGVRPIAVYSVVYRLYAKARYCSLKDDFSRVVHSDQYGGIRGRQVSTPVFHIVTHLEKAKHRQSSSHEVARSFYPHWITYDLTKAFDTVLPQLACRILEIAGYSDPFIRTYRHHLTHNVRHWKLPQRGLGRSWHSNTGIAQGCPLSAMAAVSVYGVMTRHVLRRAEEAGACVQVLSFIDDFSVGAVDARSLDIARKAMDEVVADFGLMINAAKTKVLSTQNDLAAHMHDQQLVLPYAQVSEHKILGVIAGTDGCRDLAQQFWLAKLVEVCRRVARVAHLPIAYWGRVKLIETNAVSSWRYIPLSCPLSWNEYGKIVRSIMAALGNGTSRSHAVAQEILFTTQVRLHVAHPGFAHLYNLCRMYRHHVSLRPEDAITCWDHGALHSICGSIRHLCSYLKLGLSSEGTITSRADDAVSLNDGTPDATWLHALRHCFRQHELHALQHRRPREFDGVLQVDLDQVRKCVSRVLDPYDAGIVRKFIGGGLITRDRFSRHSHSGLRFYCPECQLPETTYHVLWECSCLCAQREIKVESLPTRTCVAAAGLPAPGEMNDAQLTALYGQVARVVRAYETLRPRADWKMQVAPASRKVAACAVRLNKKTPPPPGGWIPDKVPAKDKHRIDTGGHLVEWFTNDKGKESIRCTVCRREMVARAISKLTRRACPGKPQKRDRQFVLPAGFSELSKDDKEYIRCDSCHAEGLVRQRARFVRVHATCH
eukprot:3886711-Amphidinium_carterae.1